MILSACAVLSLGQVRFWFLEEVFLLKNTLSKLGGCSRRATA